MFDIGYNIRIGSYKLGMLQSVEIHKSVDLMAWTATIVLPEEGCRQFLNNNIDIKTGDKVQIQIGYDNQLETEFDGYIQDIKTDNNSLTVSCENHIYETRKPVKDMVFGKTDVKAIAQYCLDEISKSGDGTKYELKCSHDITLESFIIKDMNAFDVLKKIKDETTAQIYMDNNTLYIQPPYIHQPDQKTFSVVYDFTLNVEKSELKYRRKDDYKFELHVEGIGPDGKRVKVIVGEPGGEKRSMIITNTIEKAELKKSGEAALQHLSYHSFEGNITTWLIPYVEPNWSAKIVDAEYDFRSGNYYITAVTTTLNGDNGGSRKVELGPRLAENG